MTPHTEIICTLGPASLNPKTILAMAKAGMDVVRLNFSHGDEVQHQTAIDIIRDINKRFKRNIKILQDLEGYRMRVGRLKHSVELREGEEILMSADAGGGQRHIPLESNVDMGGFKKGMDVFIDDGMLALKIVDCQGKKIRLKIVHGGLLKSRKGVNIPELKLKANVLTEKDSQDILFGVKNKVDYIAQSFVRNQRDILLVLKMVKPYLPDCKIIAKIENKEGVANLDDIIAACDGILIARGDLGVSMPIYQIPFIQKDIIVRCNQNKKLSITATQMLESMTIHARPTRAEVTDVANAILDGTDFVMLSGETAAGIFPVETVVMMEQIVKFTESKMMFYPDARMPRL